MNHFEMLGLDQNTSDEEAIDTAYTKARIKWQTVLNQGTGAQQRLAREMMNGKLEEAFDTLRDATKRQQYVRSLKLSQETGVPMGSGRQEVTFSLNNGFQDHEFLVIDNPVRHPLETDGLVISSLQEYVCRAWENPDWAAQHVEERTLERWMHYAAAQSDLLSALDYLQWRTPALLHENILGVTLDLLQTKYPAPLLPRSPESLLERIPEFDKPAWRISPGVANFGLLSNSEQNQIQLHLSFWRTHPKNLSAAVTHKAVKLDTSKLAAEHTLIISIDLQAIERGETINTNISVKCEPFGEQIIPVLAARANRMMGNRELRRVINGQAGHAALKVGDQRNAVRFLRMAEQGKDAAKAEALLIQEAYIWHDWQQVIELGRRFHDQYGRTNPDVQLWLIEALRMVSGSIFQLGEHRRALEYLAALAYESSQFKDKTVLAKSWTAQPEAQLQIDLENPKSDWIAVAEQYGLNWTHPTGQADGSNYAGEVPIDLSARRILWRTGDRVDVKAPLIACEGILVARSRDNRSVVALDASSGTVCWRHKEGMNGSEAAIPVAGDGMVFVADASGGVYALDIVDGNIKWRTSLGDGKDISLAYTDGGLFVGTGKRFVLLDAEDGAELASLNELRSFMADANPVNLLVTNNCCLLQMVGGVSPIMAFIDAKSGDVITYELPFVGHSITKLFFRNLFGRSAGAAVTWAAWGEFVVMPYLITKEIECKSTTVDSEGRKREESDRESWEELHFFVYAVHSEEQIAHIWEVSSGTAYQENRSCKVRITNMRSADSVAITPTFIENADGVNIFSAPQPDEFQHLLIAAAFGRHIYYWAMTDTIVKRIGYRFADGDVQSITYSGLYDMVMTQNSLMTSFIGNVEEGNATAFFFPEDLGAVVGAPAIYGDLIYVTTQSGEIAAIGR